MIAPSAPLPAGTLCRFGAHVQWVRAYATIRTGEVWDGTYECFLAGEPRCEASRTVATRDQLEPIGGAA